MTRARDEFVAEVIAVSMITAIIFPIAVLLKTGLFFFGWNYGVCAAIPSVNQVSFLQSLAVISFMASIRMPVWTREKKGE